MAVVKRLQTNFSITDNRVAQCEKLSIVAKALYFYIASLPDDWAFAIERIAKANNISEQATRKALRELEAIGLLKREMKNGGDRNGTKWEYTIFDFETAKNQNTPDSYHAQKPDDKNPECAKAGCGFPHSGFTNPLQSNNIYKEINLQKNKFTKRTRACESNQANSTFTPKSENDNLAVTPDLPEWLDKKMWQDYLDYLLNSKNHRVSAMEADLKINEFTRMHERGHDVNELIEQAMCRGWMMPVEPKEHTSYISANRPLSEIELAFLRHNARENQKGAR